jgi:PhnB protein
MGQHAVYLTFNGQCTDAINFYKDNMNGNLEMLQTFAESGQPVDDQYKEHVMHAVLDLDGFKIMFSDTAGKGDVTFGDNFSIALNFKSDAEIEKAFAAMSAGGNITMPLQDTFWGAKFGMCTDKFGVNWMFNYDKEPQA